MEQSSFTPREAFQTQWLPMTLLGMAAVLAFFICLRVGRGLFQARTLLRREFTAYFLSPVAYVVFVVFLSVTGFLFARTLDLLTTTGPKGTEFPMQTMFADERFWLVFLFIPPLLTMRLFAEERSSGTLEMLMTAPLLDWQVVLCKYLGCLLFYLVLWLPTFLYLPALLGWHSFSLNAPSDIWSWFICLGVPATIFGILLLLPTSMESPWRMLGLLLVPTGFLLTGISVYFHYHGSNSPLIAFQYDIDPMPVLGTYLGMFLAGAMFLAIGILVSSMVRDQMVSAILSMGLCLLFIFSGFWRPEQDGGTLYRTVYFFSVPLHFDRSFTRGILDTRPLILYISTAILCLFLTVRSLESRRLR